MGLEERGDAIEALDATLREAARGRGRLVVLSGDAGIGKSALAEVFEEHAKVAGFAVTRGRAWELGEAPPLLPLWPMFASLRVERPSDTGPEGAFALWERVLPALAHRTSTTKVAWIVEDAHAADLLTLDLLVLLAQPLLALPAVVLVTTRSHDARVHGRVASRLARLRRDGLDLRLSPLSPASIARLASRIAGRALPSELVARLTDITAGNPLFVVECARALMSQRPGTPLALPETIRQMVEDRLAHLPADVRAVLEAGAIVGREFHASIVAAMRGELPAQVIDAALVALRAGLVVERGPGTFAFQHVLVRDAVEEALAPATKRALHAAAERALAAREDSPERLVTRARHALEALEATSAEHTRELVARAVSMLEQAGANDRAYALRDRAAVLRARVLGEDATVEELEQLARLAEKLGRFNDLAQRCDELAARARLGGDGVLLARTALLLGAPLRPGTVNKRLVALLAEALSVLSTRDEALSCRVLARLAAALQPAADPAQPMAMARDAIARARALGDRALLVDVIAVAGSALVDFGPARERVALAEELLALATERGDERRVLLAETRLVLEYFSRGDITAYDAALERMRVLAENRGDPRERAKSLPYASMRAAARGDFDESRRCIHEALQLARTVDDPALDLTLSAHAMCLSRLAHRDEEMRAVTELGPSLLLDVPVPEMISAVVRLAMSVQLDDEVAMRRDLAILGPYEQALRQDESSLAAYVGAAAAVGDDALRARLRTYVTEHVSSRELTGGHVQVVYEGPRARLVALLDAALGDAASARSALLQCAADARSRGYRAWSAQLAYDLGRLEAQVGRNEDARAHFEESATLAESLQMSGLAARASARRDAVAQTNTCDPSARAAVPVASASHVAPPPFALAREGDVWRVTYGTQTLRVRHARGLELLARLVAHAGEEVHVLVLATDEDGAFVASDAGEKLDAQAARAYRARLHDLDELLDEAQARADRGRMAALVREKEMLVQELSAAFGQRGARRAGSVTERARVNVQRRLKDALARLGELDKGLGEYLSKAVRTGTYCSFRP